MKSKVFALAALLLIVAAAAVAFNLFKNDTSSYHSVDLSVSRLTCGSCVENIRAAVTGLGQVAGIETDVAAARTRVLFNPEKLGADAIASTITAAGYPATILSVRDSRGRQLDGIDLGLYIARVGARLVKRADFDAAFGARQQVAEAAGRPLTIAVVSQEAWYQLLKDELLFNAAEQFGVAVDEQLLLQRISSGSNKETARKQLQVDAYLAAQSPDRQMNAIELNNLLNKLYNTTTVDIFDDNLKRNLTPAKGQGGCGGGCCG